MLDRQQMENERLIVPSLRSNASASRVYGSCLFLFISQGDGFIRVAACCRSHCIVCRRGMMEDMERYYEIKKGTIPHHDNLLAISKPEDSWRW